MHQQTKKTGHMYTKMVAVAWHTPHQSTFPLLHVHAFEVTTHKTEEHSIRKYEMKLTISVSLRLFESACFSKEDSWSIVN